MKVSCIIPITINFGHGVSLEVKLDAMDGKTFQTLVRALPRIQTMVYKAAWAAKKEEKPTTLAPVQSTGEKE